MIPTGSRTVFARSLLTHVGTGTELTAPWTTIGDPEEIDEIVAERCKERIEFIAPFLQSRLRPFVAAPPWYRRGAFKALAWPIWAVSPPKKAEASRGKRLLLATAIGGARALANKAG